MKKEIGIQGLTNILFFCFLSMAGYGQPKSGQFIYNLISYDISDSTKLSAEDANALIEWMKDQFYFSAEVYFNKLWVVSVLKKNGGIRKSMYNRTSRILYTYYDGDDIKRLRIDSIQALKGNDSMLLAAIDTFKSYMQLTEYPRQKKRIHGYTCHKVTAAGYNIPPTLDEIWMAEFPNVPDLLFPEEFYFLIEGLPLEIVQDIEDIKFKWGVVKILPVRADDDIFKQKDEGYEVSVDDTKKLIYDGIHFIRTYQLKSD